MHIFTTVKVNLVTLILGMSFALMIGYAIGYFLRRMFTEYQIKEAEERRKKIVDEAEQEVSRKLRSAEIEAREKSLLLKAELEKEMKGEREGLRSLENNLETKERELRNEAQKFQTRQKELEDQSSKIFAKEKEAEQQKTEYKELVQEELKKLEVIGSYTADKARAEVKNKIVDEAKRTAANKIRLDM